MHPRLLVLTLLGGTFLLGGGSAVVGQLASKPGDWPGWRGPDRTGLCRETGLLQSWPKGGPPLVWKISGLGDGYSTPSIRDGKIYLLGTKGKTEYLRCLNAADGKERWAREIGSETRSYPGPRSTPTVDEALVFAVSSDGNLVCFDRIKGTEVWRKNYASDFGGKAGMWFYAESPLVDGDRLVCTPGGGSATIVCLDKKTGNPVWRSPIALKMEPLAMPKGGFPGKGRFPGKEKGKGMGKGFPKMEYSTAAYASPIVAETGGVRQYIQFLSGGVVGVAAKDGKLLWHFDAPSAGSANCMTPIFHDRAVFAASVAPWGDRSGCALARLTTEDGKVKVEKVYKEPLMPNQHGGVVLVGDYLYGTGRQTLVCLRFKDGKKMWEARSVGKGSILYADGRLYVRGEDGAVALVEATPDGYREKGRFTPAARSEQKAWAHPVIAGGRLYLRDWDGMACYDVKEKGQ